MAQLPFTTINVCSNCALAEKVSIPPNTLLFAQNEELLAPAPSKASVTEPSAS